MKDNSSKTNKVITWVFTGLVSLAMLGSAFGKLAGNEEAVKMAMGFGLDAKTFMMLGIIEMVCALLFIYPKTGILGAFLLVSYMGGAIATHLEHGMPVLAPCMVQALIFVAAFYRFPELRTKLINSKS